MNLEETSKVLAMIALVENRKFTDEQIAAWQSLLQDIEVNHAGEAVKRHYQQSTEMIKPAHIFKLAKEIKTETKKRRYGNFDTES